MPKTIPLLDKSLTMTSSATAEQRESTFSVRVGRREVWEASLRSILFLQTIDPRSRQRLRDHLTWHWASILLQPGQIRHLVETLRLQRHPCRQVSSRRMIVPTSLLHLTITLRRNRAGIALSSTLVGSQDPGTTGTLTAVGDQQAINVMVLDPPDGSPQSSCYLVPRTTKRSQQPEDLDYLRIKGCFSLPSQGVCEELVCRYFQLVHPFIPIINAPRFLEDFVNRRYVNTNLLILWSIFFAAASVCQQSGSYYVMS
jgi:hypothetical protein